MTLVEFLRTRLTEDEHAAFVASPGPWDYDRHRFTVTCPGYPVASWRHETSLAAGSPLLDVNGEHIARHEPSRVLREVDAKRRILDEHFGFLHPGGNPDRACRICSDRRANDDPLSHGSNDERWVRLEPAPCLTVRLLALPYADHPEFREEWRP